MTDSSVKLAMDKYRQDAAFSTYVQLAVSRAMDAKQVHIREICSEPTHKNTERLVRDVSIASAIMVLKMAFDNDAEIARLTAENARLQKLATDIANHAPISAVFKIDPNEKEAP